MPGLGHGEQEGKDGMAWIGWCHCVGEVGGAHQAIRAHSGSSGKVMKHEDPPAEAVRAHLKPGAVAGKTDRGVTSTA